MRIFHFFSEKRRSLIKRSLAQRAHSANDARGAPRRSSGAFDHGRSRRPAHLNDNAHYIQDWNLIRRKEIFNRRAFDGRLAPRYFQLISAAAYEAFPNFLSPPSLLLSAKCIYRSSNIFPPVKSLLAGA